ncbi:MAG: dephospho-CoA kinase [Acidimicrobiia bacterium]
MTAMPHRWVLSGGIGSGKSSVSSLLASSGIFVIDADSVGHQVLEPGGAAHDQVVSRWPETLTDGQIDRRRLAAIVFVDLDQLKELEAITHPHIFGTISRRVEAFDGQTVVVEMPILAHTLGDGWRRIVVDCPDDLRLSRAVGRGLSREDAVARMNAQPDRATWLAAADLVVPNVGTLGELEETVAALVPSL